MVPPDGLSLLSAGFFVSSDFFSASALYSASACSNTESFVTKPCSISFRASYAPLAVSISCLEASVSCTVPILSISASTAAAFLRYVFSDGCTFFAAKTNPSYAGFLLKSLRNSRQFFSFLHDRSSDNPLIVTLVLSALRYCSANGASIEP